MIRYLAPLAIFAAGCTLPATPTTAPAPAARPVPTTAKAAAKPTKADEPKGHVADKWNHVDLEAYLNKKGVSFARETVATGGFLGDLPTVNYYIVDKVLDRDCIRCELCANPADAHGKAGAWGKGAFSYGKFVFMPLSEDVNPLLEQFKKALR